MSNLEGISTMPQNGEMLEKISARIEKKLGGKLTAKDQDFYEILSLFVTYLSADHPKTQRMWSVFVPMAWVCGVAAIAIIGLLVTAAFGHWSLAYIP